LLLSGELLAAKPLSRIILVADTRKFHGLEAWWANLYNESRVLFALVTVICIPAAGMILGLLADLVMSRLGIDLKHRTLAER
jgi:hypothetical protein